MDESLHLTPTTLIVFIDETGIEDFSDPVNPTFGRGGCAAVGIGYQQLIERPWRKLKRGYLGGANKPFHAVDFGQSRPTKRQIFAINRFLSGKFWRFAAMSDRRTQLPEGVDAHRAISMVTMRFIERLVAQEEVDRLALVFESSHRGNPLVQRDFNLARLIPNRHGQPVTVDGFFMAKSGAAGLEVADLVAHTAGRQRRHQLAGKGGVTPDFKEMYWHSPIPPAFMSIDSVQLEEINAI